MQEEKNREDAVGHTASLPAVQLGAVDGLKNATQRDMVDVVKKQMEGLLSLKQQSGGLTHTWKGYVAELHHKATFNIDAVEKGAPVRAVLVASSNGPVDLELRHAGTVVEQVQIKTSVNPKGDCYKALNKAKYDGMQKVVARGHGGVVEGAQDHVSYDNVKSKPLSDRLADKLATDAATRKQYYKALQPDVTYDAVTAGVVGAGVGALVGGGLALVSAKVTQGEIDDTAINTAIEAAAVGACSSSAGAVASVLAESSLAGGVVSGTVVTAYQMMKECPGHYREGKCFLTKATQGAAGASAGMVACAAATAVSGPFALLTCPAAAFAANWAARETATQMLKGLDLHH